MVFQYVLANAFKHIVLFVFKYVGAKPSNTHRFSMFWCYRYLNIWTSTSIPRHRCLDIGISTLICPLRSGTSASVPRHRYLDISRHRYLNIDPDLGIDIGISSFAPWHRYHNIDPDIDIIAMVQNKDAVSLLLFTCMISYYIFLRVPSRPLGARASIGDFQRAVEQHMLQDCYRWCSLDKAGGYIFFRAKQSSAFVLSGLFRANKSATSPFCLPWWCRSPILGDCRPEKILEFSSYARCQESLASRSCIGCRLGGSHFDLPS